MRENTQPQIDGPIILTDSMATLLEALIAEGDTSGLIPTIPRFEMEGVSVGVNQISFGAADVSIEITDTGLEMVIQTDQAQLNTEGFVDLEGRRVSLEGSLFASVAVFAQLELIHRNGIQIEIPAFDIAISSITGAYQEPTVNALVSGFDNRLSQIARDLVRTVSESLTTDVIPTLLESGYAELASAIRDIPIQVQANVPGVPDTAFNLRLEISDVDHRALTSSWLTLDAYIEHPSPLLDNPRDRGVPSSGVEDPNIRGGNGLAVFASLDLFNGICHALWRAGLLNGAPSLPQSANILLGEVRYTGLLPPIIRYVESGVPHALELQVGSMRLYSQPNGALEEDVYALSFRTGLVSMSSGGRVALQTTGAPQIEVELLEDRSGAGLDGDRPSSFDRKPCLARTRISPECGLAVWH